MEKYNFGKRLCPNCFKQTRRIGYTEFIPYGLRIDNEHYNSNFNVENCPICFGAGIPPIPFEELE